MYLRNHRVDRDWNGKLCTLDKEVSLLGKNLKKLQGLQSNIGRAHSKFVEKVKTKIGQQNADFDFNKINKQIKDWQRENSAKNDLLEFSIDECRMQIKAIKYDLEINRRNREYLEVYKSSIKKLEDIKRNLSNCREQIDHQFQIFKPIHTHFELVEKYEDYLSGLEESDRSLAGTESGNGARRREILRNMCDKCKRSIDDPDSGSTSYSSAHSLTSGRFEESQSNKETQTCTNVTFGDAYGDVSERLKDVRETLLYFQNLHREESCLRERLESKVTNLKHHLKESKKSRVEENHELVSESQHTETQDPQVMKSTQLKQRAHQIVDDMCDDVDQFFKKFVNTTQPKTILSGAENTE